MNEYTKQELEEAKTALASTLHKCEKMQESGRLQSSRQRDRNTVLYSIDDKIGQILGIKVMSLKRLELRDVKTI